MGAARYLAPVPSPRFLVKCDLDSNGSSDLAVASPQGNGVAVLLNLDIGAPDVSWRFPSGASWRPPLPRIWTATVTRTWQ